MDSLGGDSDSGSLRGCNQAVGRGCNYFNTFMAGEFATKLTSMVAGRPQFLVWLLARGFSLSPCGPCHNSYFPQQQEERERKRKRVSTQDANHIFSNLMLNVTCHHFCHLSRWPTGVWKGLYVSENQEGEITGLTLEAGSKKLLLICKVDENVNILDFKW